MSLGHTPKISCQEVKAVLEFILNFGRRQQIHPRSRKFNCQRHPFHKAADTGDVAQIVTT